MIEDNDHTGEAHGWISPKLEGDPAVSRTPRVGGKPGDEHPGMVKPCSLVYGRAALAAHGTIYGNPQLTTSSYIWNWTPADPRPVQIASLATDLTKGHVKLFPGRSHRGADSPSASVPVTVPALGGSEENAPDSALTPGAKPRIRPDCRTKCGFSE